MVTSWRVVGAVGEGVVGRFDAVPAGVAGEAESVVGTLRRFTSSDGVVEWDRTHGPHGWSSNGLGVQSSDRLRDVASCVHSFSWLSWAPVRAWPQPTEEPPQLG